MINLFSPYIIPGSPYCSAASEKRPMSCKQPPKELCSLAIVTSSEGFVFTFKATHYCLQCPLRLAFRGTALPLLLDNPHDSESSLATCQERYWNQNKTKSSNTEYIVDVGSWLITGYYWQFEARHVKQMAESNINSSQVTWADTKIHGKQRKHVLQVASH